jgi:glutamate N-acetyltransferase/amino-acid N-acetyltransferase
MSTLRSWAKYLQPHMQKQWFTTAQKQTPSKDRFHQPIPSNHFPKGFRLTGLHAGIKKTDSQLDLAVILSDSPRERTASAACFTQNAFRAAPIVVCEGILAENRHARGLVVNSGCANAVTGKQGLDNAWAMSSAADALLQTSGKGTKESLVMSTGVIGHHLPLKSILSGIEKAKNSLASDFAAWERAARAFMTTDTFPKLRARTFSIDGVPVRIAGMDKGAGMIHPRMGPPSGSLHATLLAFVGTDAYITPEALQEAVNHAVSRSFNSISVDGDMSTNDTLIAIANGASDMQNAIERDTPAFSVFQTELTEFCGQLAQLIVRDGEGATKFVTLTVKVRPSSFAFAKHHC